MRTACMSRSALLKPFSATTILIGAETFGPVGKRGGRMMPESSSANAVGASEPMQLSSRASRIDVGVLSIATAVPEHIVTQRDAVRGVTEVFSGQFSDFDRISA